MMKIKTLNDLAHAICNTHDIEDRNGNLVSPKLVVEDDLGNEYIIRDVYVRRDDKVVVKIDGGGL